MMMVSLEDGFQPSDIHAMQHADNLNIYFSFVLVHVALWNKRYLLNYLKTVQFALKDT